MHFCACRRARRSTTRTRFKFEGDEHYLKTSAEMRGSSPRCPRHVTRRSEIAERANVEIEFGIAALPEFPVRRSSRAEPTRSARMRICVISRSRERYAVTARRFPTPCSADSNTSSESSARWVSPPTSSSSGT